MQIFTRYRYRYMVWIQTNANGLITNDSLIFEVCCLNKKWSCMCEEQVSLNQFLPEIQLCSARLAWSQSSAAPPPRPMYDEGARLSGWSRQSRQKLYRNKKTVEAAHGDWSVNSLQWYRIIKQARGVPSQPQENCWHGEYHRLCGRRCS